MYKSSDSITRDYYSELHPKYFCNLYWIEKVWLVIDYIQIFGIYWCAGNVWPYPYYFLLWTQWMTLFNLDLFSYTEKGALFGESNRVDMQTWGQMENYMRIYAPIFAVVSLTIGTIYYLSKSKILMYGKRLNQFMKYLQAFILTISLLLYLPCSLSLFRIYDCTDKYTIDGKVMVSVDPTYECGGIDHVTSIIVYTLATLPLLVGLPCMIYNIIRESVFYPYNRRDHEKRLQAWEISYVLGIDELYFTTHLWITSSFTLEGAYTRFFTLIFKFSICFLFVILRYHIDIQALIMLLVVFIYHGFILYITSWEGPYRLKSTNRMWIICMLMLIVNNIFGVFSAFGTTNAVMVASNQTLWLYSTNTLGVLAIICTLFYYSSKTFKYILKCLTCNLKLCSCVHQVSSEVNVEQWPSYATLYRIENDEKIANDICKCIHYLHDAQAVKYDVATSRHEVVDINSLEDLIQHLQRFWLHARQNGSIFQIIISDVLEELLNLHGDVVPHALRSKEAWDTSYTGSKDRLKHHNKRYLLTTGRKKRILTKLLALSAFKNEKDFDLINFVPNITQLEIKRMRTKIDTETTNTLDLLENDLFTSLVTDTQTMDFIVKLRTAMSFWQRITLLLEEKMMPGWEKYSEEEIEDWYFMLRTLNERIHDLEDEIDDDHHSHDGDQFDGSDSEVTLDSLNHV